MSCKKSVPFAVRARLSPAKTDARVLLEGMMSKPLGVPLPKGTTRLHVDTKTYVLRF